MKQQCENNAASITLQYAMAACGAAPFSHAATSTRRVCLSVWSEGRGRKEEESCSSSLCSWCTGSRTLHRKL